MNYHPDDFEALSNAVVNDGGECLAEVCEPKEFRLKLPDSSGRMRWSRRWTTGCEMSAKMALPYNPRTHIKLIEDNSDEEPITIVDHEGEDFDGSDVIACAVDDAIGLWPRYASVISSRSYQS